MSPTSRACKSSAHRPIHGPTKRPPVEKRFSLLAIVRQLQAGTGSKLNLTVLETLFAIPTIILDGSSSLRGSVVSKRIQEETSIWESDVGPVIYLIAGHVVTWWSAWALGRALPRIPSTWRMPGGPPAKGARLARRLRQVQHAGNPAQHYLGRSPVSPWSLISA